MILVKITGGPGNQLFQYAFGRHLAEINKTILKLDLSEYDYKKHRKFILHRFKIKAQIASKEERASFLKFSRYFPYDLRPQIHHIFPFYFKNIIYEKLFRFDNRILEVKNNNYLIGFWQSEKYFSGIKKKLQSEMSLKSAFSRKSRQLLNLIKKTESVSISVRRGDFVSDPEINKNHGVLDYSYYKSALKIITKKIKTPHLFIFSDEIDWIKKNWKFAYKTAYADFNFPDKTEEDLILGSLCKHNIIANSTFSWWTAWLNKNKNKIVIAPDKWFNQLNYDTGDLIPDSWIRI